MGSPSWAIDNLASLNALRHLAQITRELAWRKVSHGWHYAAGHQPSELNTIADSFSRVAGPGEHLCTPCGGCRQKIREFATSELRVHVVTKSGQVSSFSFAELLPESFGPDNLGV